MNKYGLAAEHSVSSLVGLARTFFRHPAFAVRIFQRRLRYFLNRTFEGSFLTPDRFLIDTPDTLIAYWSMFVERELYDACWVEPLRTADQPLVVDVGANAGVFSHFAFCLNPQAEIIAFEPLPAMRARFKALQERTGMNLTCHATAVSSSIGEVLFESPHGYDGTSRISSSAEPTDNKFRVQTTTLDTMLADRSVMLMKIDVEGFECEVIAGGGRTLANTQYLIIEAQTEEHLANVTRAIGAGWNRRKLGSSDYLFYRQ